MIRIIVLGTNAALPSKNGLPACAAVRYGGTYLFDACEAVQQQMMKYGGGSAIKAIFITHLHADHVLGVPGLLQSLSLAKRTEPMIIVGPAGSKKFFSNLLSIPGFVPSFPVELIEMKKAGIALKTDLFKVKAFKVKHSIDSVGYALICNDYQRFDKSKAMIHQITGGMFNEIMEKGFVKNKSGKKIILKQVSYKQKGKKIVFTGDTAPCKSTITNCKDADLLFHDSTFADSEEKQAKLTLHSTAKQAATIAKKGNVKKLVLTHISNRYDNRDILLNEANEIFDQTIVAQEGMEILV